MTTKPGPVSAGLLRAPSRNTASYKAAALIYETGSKTEADLFSMIDFGARPDLQMATLERALETGWLRRLPDFRIALTDFALEYFETEPEPKYVGQVAGPRSIDVMHRPAYKPPKRLPRDSEPEWSVRVGASFHTKA